MTGPDDFIKAGVAMRGTGAWDLGSCKVTLYPIGHEGAYSIRIRSRKVIITARTEDVSLEKRDDQ